MSKLDKMIFELETALGKNHSVSEFNALRVKYGGASAAPVQKEESKGPAEAEKKPAAPKRAKKPAAKKTAGSKKQEEKKQAAKPSPSKKKPQAIG